MNTRFAAVKLMLAILIPSISFAGCVPFAQARAHIGETQCIKGKVLHVDESQPGLASLSFCKDRGKCAFTALVSSTDKKNIASLHELQGKTVKIHGLVKESNGDAQIVLQDPRQLLSQDEAMPSFMKTYDVEERGHYSAGTSYAPRTKRVYTKKQTATGSIDIPSDAEDGDQSTP